VSKPSSAAPPKPAVKPSPTQQTPTQPAAAKRGGVPKWIYAVGGVVVLAIIGVLALSGGGDVDNLPEESAATSEEVAQDVASDSSDQFNYFNDPDGWVVTDFFVEGDEFEAGNGQAILSTQLSGPTLIAYDEAVGDGTYEVKVTMPDVEWGTAAFGLIIPFDNTQGDWYQFFLWNEGSAVVDYCWDFCSDDYENLIKYRRLRREYRDRSSEHVKGRSQQRPDDVLC
jgi:hypothetical protein